MNRRALVTGGSGVVGLELVDRLARSGREVLSVDLVPSPDPIQHGVQYLECNLAECGMDVVSDFNPQEIYHLAASFERTQEDPAFWSTSAVNNVLASEQVLRGALRSNALERYIYASSYLIFDAAQYLAVGPKNEPSLLSEVSPIRPRNVTGAAKLLHEMEIELAFADVEQVSVVSARIFRVFGRRSRDVLSRWVRSALQGQAVPVFGASARFDYIFAADVAEGLRRLGEIDFSGVVNLGSGVSRSVFDALQAIESQIPGLRVVDVDSPGPLEASCADISLLKELTGWQPEISLEVGVASIVAFESNVNSSIFDPSSK